MTFTTFDLGGHEQGKSEVAGWEAPNELKPPDVHSVPEPP